MPDLLIRNLPDDVNARLEALAKAQRRSKEKQALVLIEDGLASGRAETGGELLEIYDRLPPPKVEVKEIEAFIASRGRRSKRR